MLNTAPAFTSTSLTMQARPILSASSDIVATRFDAGDPQALVVVDGSVAIVQALVGTPCLLSRRRHLETGDRVQGEVPETDAPAILSRGRRADQAKHDYGE